MRWRGRLVLAVVLAGCGEPAAPAIPTSGTLEELTAALVAADDPGAQVEIARLRAPVWDQAAASEPERALSAAVPDGLELPAEARPYVERAFDRRGAVASYVTELPGAEAFELWMGETRIYAAGTATRVHPRSGSLVRAVGYQHGPVAVAGTLELGPSTRIVAKWGTRRVLAVMLSFTDFPATRTASSVSSALFGASHTPAAFYSAISNGQIAISGDVVGPFAVDDTMQCSIGKIEQQTFDVLAANHLDIADYQTVIAIVPGAKQCSGNVLGQSMLGPSLGAVTFEWAQDSDLYVVPTHELGHGAGLQHAHAYLCEIDPNLPAGVDIPADTSECPLVDTGNGADMMSDDTGFNGNFNAFELEYLGWLGNAGFGTIQNVTASGTFSLVPVTTLAGTRVLEIPYDVDPSSGHTRFLYVEYRTKTGNDAPIVEQAVLVGFGIHDDNDSNILAKSLAAGDSFVTPSGLTITATSETAAGATVTVTIPAASGTCTRSTPRMVLLDGSSPENTYLAGSTVTYTLEFQNRDSAGCGPTAFTPVETGLPAGWTFDAPVVAASPGSFVTAQVYVTAPAGATGSQTFSVSMHDPATTGHDSTGMTAGFAVSACNPVAPTVTLSPASGMQVAPGGSATYLYSFTNNNTSACGNTSLFTLSGAASQTGWTFSGPAVTAAVAPGQTVTGPFTVTAPATTTSGTFQVGVQAYFATSIANGSQRWGESLVNAPVTIGTACVHTNPVISIAPSTQTSTTGGELDYTVTVKNIDGANCTAAQSVALSVGAVANYTTTLDASALTLAPGASGTTTLRMTPQSVVIGSVTATVTAANGGAASSAVATYVLTCGAQVKPKVLISPDSIAAGAGDRVDYLVTVTNPNTSTLCPTHTYALTSDVINLNGTTGWVTAVSTPTMTIASNSSATTTLSVTSPASATGPFAVYEPIVNATDENGLTAGDGAFYAILCGDAAPSISVSPLVQTASVGGDAPIAVTIKNNDSRGCPAASIAVSQALPSGWTSTVASSVSLAGGESTTITATAHVPASAKEGAFTVKTNAEANGFLETASAEVDVPCPGHVAPAVVLSPSSQATTPGLEAAFLVTVTNNDPAACKAQSFAFAGTAPAGWTASMDDSPITIAPGASDGTTLRVTPPSDAFGSGTVTATITGSAGSSGAGTGTLSITCTAKKATVSLAPATQTASPGTPLVYTATIANPSSGCAPDTFTVTDAVPAGWTATLGSSSVTLASGASTTVSLTVTSPDSASGSNTVSVSAKNGVGTTTASATDAVTCTRGTPAVSMAPSAQSGSAGAALAYTATIKNTDKGCAAGTFAVAKSVPSGWSGSLSKTSVSLASGASVDVTLTATSIASAFGDNPVSVTASNAASGSATGSATYTVVCARGVPVVTLSPSSRSASAGTAVTYTATVTNGDAGCAAGTLDLAAGVPAGWSGSLSPSTVSVASGGSSTSTFTVTSAADATGSNPVSVTASNAASGSGAGSGTYVVTAVCTRGAPSVAIGPASQSGTAGSALAYTVSVTNNDTAGCASGTFALTRTLPAMPPGFTGTFSTSSLAIAPGAIGTSTLTVTSPAGAMPGTKTFTATASNAASGSGTATGSYVIAAACTRHAPSVALAPSTQSGVAGSTLAYTATVTNNDVACGSSTFAVSDSGPTGWTLALGATSVTLVSGGSQDVALSVTSAAAAAPGTFALSVTASDPASGSGTGTASEVVTPACVRGSPGVAIAPSSQSGVAGSTLAYSATITNNDANCGSSTIALAPVAPSGWTVTVAPSVTLASGASTAVSVAATSPAAAVLGTFQIGVTAGTTTGLADDVIVPACVHGAPTLAVAPASQTSAPGAAVTYTLTLANHDVACAAGAFALTAALPAGWTSSFATTPVALASGASADVTWTVTSKAGEAAGDFTVTATATDAASGAASASATDSIAAVCVRSAPVVAIAPGSQSGVAGTTLHYTATITNLDANCADEAFALAHAEDAGFDGALVSGSVTLASGASATVGYDVTSPASASGNHTVSVTATGGASGAGTGTAIDAVTAVCTRNAPVVTIAPSTQAGTPGSPLVYAVTAQNEDVGCAPQTLAMAASAPAGWTATFDTASAQVASGAAVITHLTVMSAADAVGDTDVPVTVTGSSSGAGSGTATYSVTCSHGAPVVTLTPSAQTTTGGAVTFEVAVTDTDSGCELEDFALSGTVPAGWTSTVVGSTWTVTPADGAAAKSYTVTMSAAGEQTGVATATVTVEGGDPPPAGKSGGCQTGGDSGWLVALGLGWLLLQRRDLRDR